MDMEGFPFRLFLVVLIMGFVVSVSVYVTNFFLAVQSEQVFRHSVESLVSSIETLSSIADYGSFDLVSLRVPLGDYLLVDNESELIEIKGMSYNLSVDIINSLNLSFGTYNIELYYGEPGEIKDYTIAFG